MNILLADDNEANRLVVRALLERDGHILSFAENGQIAVDMCSTHIFDLILMDILMPVMDGVRALRRLRHSGGPNAKTPVFAFTAYSSPEDKHRYRQVGFDRVLAKPLRVGDIERAWAKYNDGISVTEQVLSHGESKSFNDVELLNPDIIKQLFETTSEKDVAHIIRRFHQSVREKHDDIRAHVASAMTGQNESLSTVRQAAHAIKGAAATLGLSRVSRIAAKLQNAPPENLTSLMTQFDIDLLASEAALIDMLKANRLKADCAEARLSGANALTA